MPEDLVSIKSPLLAGFSLVEMHFRAQSFEGGIFTAGEIFWNFRAGFNATALRFHTLQASTKFVLA